MKWRVEKTFEISSTTISHRLFFLFLSSFIECHHADVSWGEKPGGWDQSMAVLALTTTFGKTENFGCW
jgi:hypothetical protein